MNLLIFYLWLGVYGVLAYSVSLRRREFGIRIVFGSGKSALIELVMRQAARPVLLGTGVGLTMAPIRAALGAQSPLSNALVSNADAEQLARGSMSDQCRPYCDQKSPADWTLLQKNGCDGWLPVQPFCFVLI